MRRFWAVVEELIAGLRSGEITLEQETPMHRNFDIVFTLVGNTKTICAIVTDTFDGVGHAEEAKTAEELVEKLKPFLVAKIKEQFQ